MAQENNVRPEIEELGERKRIKLSDAPKDKESKITYGSKVDLTSDQEETLLTYLETEIQAIETERDEIGLPAIWEANEDQYYGNLPDKTFPFEESSNINVPLTREKIDVIAGESIMAIHTPEDIWEVIPTQAGGKNIEEILKASEGKQKFLTYVCRNEINYKVEHAPVIFDACLHGTGWLELPWHYQTDTLRDVEKYVGRGDLDKFLRIYKEDLEDSNYMKERAKYIKRLQDDKIIEITVEFDAPVWDNPKPAHVPIRDLFIHPHVKNMVESRFHGKRYKLTGAECMRKKNDKIFENVDELRYEMDESTGELTWLEEFDNQEFECYTIELRYSFKIGKDKKYLIDCCLDKKRNKRILFRVRRFPYWHNRSYFIPHYISDKKGEGIYREGLCEILADSQELSNVALNFLMDCLLFGSIPIVKANANKRRELSPQLRKGLYPGITLWLKDRNDVSFETTKAPALGGLGDILQLAAKYGQLQTGIGEYMTGKEASADPRAPAEKTKMLLEKASRRMAGFISTLQESNREVAFQLIELYYQYKPDGKVYRAIGEDGDFIFPRISRESLRHRTEYSPIGSIDHITKGMQFELAIRAYDLFNKDQLLQMFPENRRYILDAVFKSMGGIWEKSRDKMLPSKEEIMQREVMMRAQAMIMKEQMEKRQQRTDQIKARAKALQAQGASKEQVEAAITKEFPSDAAGGPGASAVAQGQGGAGELPQDGQRPTQ